MRGAGAGKIKNALPERQSIFVSLRLPAEKNAARRKHPAGGNYRSCKTGSAMELMSIVLPDIP